MKVTYDKEVDILYIKLSDSPIQESSEDKPGIILDYNAEGMVVGVEILNASHNIKNPNMVELEVA